MLYTYTLSVIILYIVHTLAWKNGLAEVKTYKSNQLLLLTFVRDMSHTEGKACGRAPQEYKHT